ncbi:MAG: class I SAM-dependent methyltransferase, partial [Akkermansiaceae bacterium]|nr:class I SAM-dependent methyltransferase [Akkermansiaceae bacterium]
FGLRNMASWPGALAEMARVVRPGGLVLVLDFSLPGWPLAGPYRFYLHRVLPRIAGWLTGEREAYQYLSGSIEQFPSGE